MTRPMLWTRNLLVSVESVGVMEMTLVYRKVAVGVAI